MPTVKENKNPKATNAGWSANIIHRRWAQKEADRLTIIEGKKVTASEVIRRLIDEKRKEEERVR